MNCKRVKAEAGSPLRRLLQKSKRIIIMKGTRLLAVEVVKIGHINRAEDFPNILSVGYERNRIIKDDLGQGSREVGV